jgi:hypothetical protein
MHAEAYEWVSRFASADPLVVLDIGGRNINGTALDHFPNADRTVLDIAPGPGVDIVADAASWVPDREYDVITCCEVAEHTAVWPQIVATAFKALRQGGSFILTCAGPGRFRHSAVDGGRRLFPGEHYANVSVDELGAVLDACGFVDVVLDSFGEDTRAWARKP